MMCFVFSGLWYTFTKQAQTIQTNFYKLNTIFITDESTEFKQTCC